jgi:hypothetical protein
VGVLPIIVTPHPVLGQRRPILRTDGKLTPSGDLPLAPDCATEAFEALLAEVRRQVPNYCELSLPAVRQNSPVLTALQNGIGKVLCGYPSPWSLRKALSTIRPPNGGYVVSTKWIGFVGWRTL